MASVPLRAVVSVRNEERRKTVMGSEMCILDNQREGIWLLGRRFDRTKAAFR